MLKRMDLRQPYKGHKKYKDKRANQAHILEEIEDTGIVTIKSSALRATILDNPGGDALESVIAAFATFQAIGSSNESSISITSNSMLEGYVCF